MTGRRARIAAIALLPLLLLPAIAAPVGGQLPSSPDEEFFRVNVRPDPASVVVDYLGTATVQVTLEDVSYSRQTEPNPVPNQVILDAEVLGNDTVGWQAQLSPSTISTRPGETTTVALQISAGATIQEPTVEVRIEATYQPRAGEQTTTNATVLAVAEPNPVVRMDFQGTFPEFRPDERQRVPLQVTNFDYYPEMVSFRVNAPEGWVVSAPSSVYLAPGETETVYFDIKAPQDPWFRFNPTSDVVSVTVETQTNPGGSYTMAIPTPLSGWFLPGWVIPHIILLLLGATIVTKRTAQKAREHRLEKGKPTFPGLPPEKEARYEAMKHKDPERAEEMQDRLERLHEQRVAAWKDDYKERRRRERKRRKEAKKRHDAILEKKKREEKRRREAERRERKEIERKRKKREKLRKKREKLEERREQARKEREAELTEAMREEREEREQGEAPSGGSQEDAELEAKRRRLEELKRKKREEQDSDGAEADQADGDGGKA